MCSIATFRFRWLRGYILRLILLSHQMGSMTLCYCYIYHVVCLRQLYSSSCFIWIPGELFYYYCAVYGVRKLSSTLRPEGRHRFYCILHCLACFNWILALHAMILIWGLLGPFVNRNDRPSSYRDMALRRYGGKKHQRHIRRRRRRKRKRRRRSRRRGSGLHNDLIINQ